MFIEPAVFDEPCEFPAFQHHATAVLEFSFTYPFPPVPNVNPSLSKDFKLWANVCSASVVL